MRKEMSEEGIPAILIILLLKLPIVNLNHPRANGKIGI